MPPTHDIPTHVRQRAWKREQRIITLGYASYNDYIRSPAWRAVKRRYAEQQPWICNICGTEDGLQLHHRTYERVGEERLEDLMPLCEDCHEMVHTLERRGDTGLDFDGVINTARALRNRAAIAAQQEAVAQEQRDDIEAFKASLENLPLDERVRRLRKTAPKEALHSLRGLRFRTEVLPEAMILHIREAERKAYGF